MKNIKFHPSQYSSQKETIRVEKIIGLNSKIIWEELIDYESMVDWMPGISSVKVKHNHKGTQGLGCERVCQFGPEILNEKIVLFEEGKAYGYKIQDNSLIEDHVAFITLEEISSTKTKVSWIQHFKPRGNFIKQFIMKKVMFPRTLKKGLFNLSKRLSA